VIPLLSQSELATDDLFHDLVRSGPDLGHACIFPRPRDAILVHESIATVQLYARVEDIILHLGRPPLGLRRIDARKQTLRVRQNALVDERLRNVDLVTSSARVNLLY
jgi:hypothetical protein